ncbi:MAG: hypothetical protein KA226_11825 [Gemmatimonadales bacterium]|nr:hypothetical protein [Gemmatimonadales bacterium]
MRAKPARPAKVFKPHLNAKKLRQDALTLVRTIVDLNIEASLKRRMLNYCLWTLTESEGTSKYRTKYMTQGAMDESQPGLHHDHVFTRKQLIEDMLREPARAVEIAETAVGCTVTRFEHKELTYHDRVQPELTGWDRYRAIGIVVINTETGEPI